MAKKFRDLRMRLSPEARQRVEEQTRALLEVMPLAELRQARLLSQEQLAATLGIKQSSISKLEHRTDMYIQTLRSYVEAMGGRLEIKACFPDGEVVIDQFEGL